MARAAAGQTVTGPPVCTQNPALRPGPANPGIQPFNSPQKLGCPILSQSHRERVGCRRPWLSHLWTSPPTQIPARIRRRFRLQPARQPPNTFFPFTNEATSLPASPRPQDWPRAHRERPGLIAQAGHRRRVHRQQPQRLLQRRAGKLHEIRQGAVQRQHAAGQHAVRPWLGRWPPAPQSRPVDTRRPAFPWRSSRRSPESPAPAPWPSTTASPSPEQCGCRRRSTRQKAHRRSAPCPECPARDGPAARMALKVCVALTAPAAMAARVSAAVAFEWPSETRTPRAVACAASSTAPGSSGASVISRTWPSAASKNRSKVAMSGASRSSAGCAPRLACERNGPSR